LELKQMSHRKLISVLDSLPPEAQRQVADFIAFLKKQHELVSRPTKQNGSDLSRQPFIGMWRDRDDLKDSSAWVRKTRQQEWSDA
jgi:predicted transcriptional regulator